ncbi:MAG: glycoside hydrolase family 16 protein [Bacteroidota bacterium]
MKKKGFLNTWSSYLGLFALCTVLQNCGGQSPTEEAVHQQSLSYELVWSDEFDYEGKPDATRWALEIGDGCPNLCGWGNSEQQYYTDDSKNVRVEDGKLIIEARKQSIANSQYSSAKVVSNGKADWMYGRYVTRARLPEGRGLWSAIWMLPSEWKYGNWPASGEIDIMEHIGGHPDSILGTVHTKAYNHLKGTHRGSHTIVSDAFENFHDYIIEWTPEKIDFYVDDELYFTFPKEGRSSAKWPFDQRFYFILNVAVGGTLGGSEGIDDEMWPRRMEVDYVRVYQLQ